MALQNTNTMWRNLKKRFARNKKKIVFITLIVLVLFFGVNYFVKYTSNKKCYKNLANIPACETGIVLGAGVGGSTPSKYLEDRLDAAVDLYKSGKVRKLLLTGDNGRKDYDELIVMKRYCFEHGVDTADIFLDYAGFDTYSSLYRAKQIFKVEKAIIVSQNYHIDRAVFIGNRLGIDCYGFAADKGDYNNYRKNVIREYIAVIKSVFDLTVERKPKYLGETVDITGDSNYTSPIYLAQKENNHDIGRKERLNKILTKAETMDISKIHFDFDRISENENNLIDSLSFIDVYQVDSLITNDAFYSESPVYILGKSIREKYDILVTIRYHGTWLKTIDLLTYDKTGNLKGFIFLAGWGGDANYAYDSAGHFENGVYTNTSYSKDIEEDDAGEIKYADCIKTVTKTLLNDAGETMVLNKQEKKIACDK